MTTDTNRSVLTASFTGYVTVLVAAVVTAIVALSFAFPASALADGPNGAFAPNEYDWYSASYYPEEDSYDWYGASYDYDEYYTYDSWYDYEDYYSYDDYYSYESDYYYDDYSYEPYYVDYSYDYYDYGCNSDCYDYPDYGCHSGCYEPEPEPVCAISASDTTIEEGDDVDLHWTSENASSATLSSFGSVSTGGNRSVSPDHDTTYTLTVRGHGGTDTCSVRINVEEEDDDNDLWCELDVSDSRVQEGDEVTLEWDTRGADYASINQGVGRVDEDGGEEDVDVDEDTTFRLTVRDNDGDEETCSASVRVDDEDDFSSIRFDGDPVNNPPTVYLSQLPYTGIEDMTPSLMASVVMLAALLGIAGYFVFVKRRTV